MSSSKQFRDPDEPLTDEQRFFRRETLREIEAAPHMFDMGDWERRSFGGGCSTARCVAGWAQYLRRGAVYPFGLPAEDIPDAEDDAVALMGLTREEYLGESGEDPLFYTEDDDALARLRALAEA